MLQALGLGRQALDEKEEQRTLADSGQASEQMGPGEALGSGGLALSKIQGAGSGALSDGSQDRQKGKGSCLPQHASGPCL
jgi:hypothetical protein